MKYKKNSNVNSISLVITIFCFVTVLIFQLRKNSRLTNYIYISKESDFYTKIPLSRLKDFDQQQTHNFFNNFKGEFFFIKILVFNFLKKILL